MCHGVECVRCATCVCCVRVCRGPCRVVSCRVASCRVASCRVASCRVVSCRVVSRHVVSGHVVSRSVVSRRVAPRRVLSCRVASRRVVSCRASSCRVVSCSVESCRVPLCHMAPCHVCVCMCACLCLCVSVSACMRMCVCVYVRSNSLLDRGTEVKRGPGRAKKTAAPHLAAPLWRRPLLPQSNIGAGDRRASGRAKKNSRFLPAPSWWRPDKDNVTHGGHGGVRLCDLDAAAVFFARPGISIVLFRSVELALGSKCHARTGIRARRQKWDIR